MSMAHRLSTWTLLVVDTILLGQFEAHILKVARKEDHRDLTATSTSAHVYLSGKNFSDPQPDRLLALGPGVLLARIKAYGLVLLAAAGFRFLQRQTAESIP